MKKILLSKINVLLGALSLGLAGCHTPSKVPEVKYGPFIEPKKYGPPPVEIMRPDADAEQSSSEAPAEESPKPDINEPAVCKYGPPSEL